LLDDPLLADDALVGLVPEVERAGRLVDGLRVRAAHLVDARTSGLGSADTDGSLAHRYGHRSANAFLKHLTRASGRTIAARIHLGAATATRSLPFGAEAPAVEPSLASGTGADSSDTDRASSVTTDASPSLPARFPAVATALAAGELALDAAHTITRELSKVSERAEPEHVQLAEATLVAHATGTPPPESFPAEPPGTPGLPPPAGGTTAGEPTSETASEALSLFPVHADTIRTLTHGWATVLDQDSTRPVEGDLDKRYLWL